MTSDLRSQLQAIELPVLTEVVRKIHSDPDLQIYDWTVTPLVHEIIISTTGGLFLFSGQSDCGPWKVVLKCLHNPIDWAQEPRGWVYWKREAVVYPSGLLEHLPAGVRGPRCYGVVETEDGAWVWLEYIEEATPKQWSLESFQRAALRLGRFQGAYLSGAPLPGEPWLCYGWFRGAWDKQGFWSDFLDPASENSCWKVPVVQEAYSEGQKARVLRLLEHRQRFFGINDRLPQVFCHYDFFRRNLMWSRTRQSGEDELIALDWAFTGAGAVGNDLGELIGSDLRYFEYDPEDGATLETTLMESYLAGIAEQAAEFYPPEIDPRLVRLGYLISLMYRVAVSLPGWTAIQLQPGSGTNVQAMFGRPAEEVLAGWVKLLELFLERGDEMERLAGQLGF